MYVRIKTAAGSIDVEVPRKLAEGDFSDIANYFTTNDRQAVTTDGRHVQVSVGRGHPYTITLERGDN